MTKLLRSTLSSWPSPLSLAALGLGGWLIVASQALALSGGAYVKHADFPASVAFHLPKVSTQERCTAIKVAPAIFLTAAHCFDRYFDEGKPPLVVFTLNDFTDYDKPSNARQALRTIAGVPILHPSYYRITGGWNAFWNNNFWDDVDLAIFKTNADIRDIALGRLSPYKVTVGLTLTIGGFGPPNPTADCKNRPCPFRMGTQLVSSVSKVQAAMQTTTASTAFLTGGDSGGPAYLMGKTKSGSVYEVVGINQFVAGLSNPNSGKESHITLIAPALDWINQSIHKLQTSK